MAYEQKWDSLSPDWTVLADDDKPLAFVEVHTDQPPSRTFGQIRAWHDLVERIKAIPIPVILRVASDGGPLSPPDAGTSRRIAADLHNQLVKFPWSTVLTSRGYRFHVMADPRRGGQQALSPLGMHAAFDPPTSRAGSVSAKPMMEQVKGKVRAYGQLAERYDVPLVVAIGSHRFTGVRLLHVDDILTGLEAPKLTFQLGSGDPYIGEQEVRWAPIPPWQWPAELSGLLWVESELPFPLVPRPNPAARRQMPVEMSGSAAS